MTDKYKVSKAVMDELNTLKDRSGLMSIKGMLRDIEYTSVLQDWVYNCENVRELEQAVIDFIFNNADNFEVKTPTWVIVSKENKAWKDWWSFIFVTDGLMERWEAYSYLSRPMAIKHATRITDPHIKDMLLELNKDFEAVEVEE